MYQSNALAKSKIETELDFLAALEQGEVVTQITLSKRVAVSVGLINALLKRAIRKGYAKARAVPRKRYAYYLTPQGFTEKSRLVAKYLETSLGFFRKAKHEYRDVFAKADSLGMQQVALIGGGELAEIALLVSQEAAVEVKIIFERTTNNNLIHGLAVVRSIDELSNVDGFVITDAWAPQEATDLLRAHFSDDKVLVPPLLHVTNLLLDFKPPKVLSKDARQ